jgi:patatin-related protein
LTTERELRLALGMRGGVSLAVWIGGACAEIDKVRRSGCSSPPSEFWRDVVGKSAYDRVVVDVFAGASAGGLNGALYASSVVYGFPLDEVREVWLAAGNTDVLLRADEPSLSLFDGDGVFLRRVYDALSALVGQSDQSPDGRAAREELDAGNLALSLSATLVEQVERRDASPSDEIEWERRSASGFHFEHHREAWRHSDFPAGDPADEEPRRSALARLALSARATSSFPGAFEPAIVHSGRPPRFSSLGTVPAGPGTTGRPFAPGDVDLAGAFLDRTGHGDETFLVADGGILDNIPLSRAIRDIVAAPANGPTKRVLLYLHPGVPSHHVPPDDLPQATDPDAERRRRAVPALARGVVKAFRSEETIGQDMEAIELHTELVSRARTVRSATFTPLLPADAGGALASDGVDDDVRRAYAQRRGFEDAQMLAHLLTDPIATLEVDPFPRIVGIDHEVTDDQWRSPMGALTAVQRQAVRDRLWVRCLERAVGEVLRVDIAPIQRVANVLLDSAWSLEARAVPVDVHEQKEALYRILNFAGEVLAAPREWAWVAAAAATLSDPDTAQPTAVVDRALPWIDNLPRLDPTIDAAAMVEALRHGTDEELLDRYRDRVLERIDALVAGIMDPSAPSPGALTPDQDIRSMVLIPALVGIAADLRGHGAAERVFHPGYFVQAYLAGGGDVDVETLTRLEVLCHAEFVTGRPCQSEIEFRRLSAANRVPIAPSFELLIAAAKETGKWWDPAVTAPDAQGGIHVDLKLAGNELANFAAFLLPEWRANDWLWGRLDSVPTLVDLLVTPSALIAQGIVGDDGMAAMEQLSVPRQGPAVSDEAIERITAFFESRRSNVRAQLLELATKAAEMRATGSVSEPDVDVADIRDVLVARRQWEILDEELRKVRHASGDVPRPGTRALTGPDSWDEKTKQAVPLAVAVERYDAGAQTTRHPDGHEQATDRAAAIRDRFDELVDHGTRTVVDNLDAQQGGPVPTSFLSGATRGLVLRVLRLVAGFAVRPFLPVTKGRLGVTGTTAIVLLGAGVAAGVYAWSRDWIAFLIGLVLVIAVIGAFLWFTRPRAKK